MMPQSHLPFPAPVVRQCAGQQAEWAGGGGRSLPPDPVERGAHLLGGRGRSRHDASLLLLSRPTEAQPFDGHIHNPNQCLLALLGNICSL